MTTNPIRNKLVEGRSLVGSVVTIPDPFVAEVMSRAPFDFLVIDMQHAPLSLEAVQGLLIAISASSSGTLVRVPSDNPTIIGQVLDLGPDGVIVPLINSADQLEAAMRAARYPPDGIRSWGPRRAARLHGDSEAYATGANGHLLVIPQIETMEAVENLDGILAVRGCEAIMIGPADLARSMHLPLNTEDDLFHDTVRGVLDACRAKGTAFGHFTGTVGRARQWISLGAGLTTVGGDLAFLTDGMAGAVSQLQEAADGRSPLLARSG